MPGRNILHIGKFYPPTPGGMERFVADLATAQVRRGHDVTVLVHGERTGVAASVGGPFVYSCRVWLRLVFTPISPFFPVALRRLIKGRLPDVLHIHLPNPSAFWALLLPSARSIPWVIHWHSDVEPSKFSRGLRLIYPYYAIFERLMLERADAIVVTSHQYLNSSQPLRQWRHKCQVVPLGIDLDRMPEPAPSTAARHWWGQGLRLLAVGRLTYYKGFETLIEAVATSEGNMELAIVGEGDCRSALEDCLRRFGNPATIRLLGQLDDQDCLELMASCDVYCLPSRERTEAFGIVLMEAMRYGKPIVASRIEGSGVMWVVRDGENGILAAVDRPSDWQQALHYLAANPAVRAQMGKAGRGRLMAEMTIDQVARNVDDIYARVEPLPIPLGELRDEPLVVIPARNEAATIAQVIAGIRANGCHHIAVVDDGSSDATAALARERGVTVIQAPLAQGAWGAMQTGIRFAMAHGYAGVITIDADGQHEPGYLGALLDEGRSADVVIGACPQRGSRLRRVAWAYFRFLTGFAYEDLTSGFRYYNCKACRLLAQEQATLLDYQDIGVLLMLHHAGLIIREIPVTMNSRQVGASRIFTSWLTVARYMFETTLLCLARWQTRGGCR